MIIVYSHHSSKRLQYTLNVIFKYVLGIDYTLTTKLKEFKNSNLAKLNYSENTIEGVYQIYPSPILFEVDVRKLNLDVDWDNEVPFIFKTHNGQHDLLASVFWMVTRYEEYLSFKEDSHGRFPAQESLAYKNNFLHIPVVNHWCKIISKEIVQHHSQFNLPTKTTMFINSLDIDVAYMYKGKPYWRFLAGFVKDILKRNKEGVKLRLEYVKNGKDLYDTYNFIRNSSDGIKTIYFFLLGDTSKNDHNVSHNKKSLQQLIKHLALKNDVGIHPSYLSNSKQNQLSKEVERLQHIVETPVKMSRQHFLKLQFPNTYENLISNNITSDYTMGYADQIGFRAGICNAFPFYNIKLEQERPLWIVPFQVMDGTLNQYLSLTPEQAVRHTKKIIDEVKKVKGTYVSLWHNSSLSELDIWKGWSIVYQESLKMMK